MALRIPAHFVSQRRIEVVYATELSLIECIKMLGRPRTHLLELTQALPNIQKHSAS